MSCRERRKSKVHLPEESSKLKTIILPSLMRFVALATSCYCFFIFYTECDEKEVNSKCRLVYIAFIVTFANAIAGLPPFRDDTFCEVRVLLDYAQEILPLPCICSEIWNKHEMASPVISDVHAMGAIFTFFFFIVYEAKRPDLTDLTIISNCISMFLVALVNMNYFAIIAAVLFFNYYYCRRRKEECCLTRFDEFNTVMVVFNLIVLAAFEPKSWLPGLLQGSAEPKAETGGLLPTIFSSTAVDNAES